jgi:adenine-specific DNA-methyltransferase
VPAPFGPGNPHPLSTLKTELVWEGKYDEYGNRREMDAASLAMPLQRIETVDEPRARAEAQGGLFDTQKAHLDDFRNMLVWGDNKLVVASILKEYSGKVDLIYIDPPFDVGADFTMEVPIGDGSEAVGKDQSVLEMVAYRDMWGKGTDSYLHMMYERLALMKSLLSPTGSIFVHCDWHVSHALKVLLDDVFGPSHFVNEIVVNRGRRKNLQKQFTRIAALGSEHDVILAYRRSERGDFAHVRSEVRAAPAQWQAFWRGNVERKTMQYELLGFKPTHGQFLWSEERAKRAVKSYEEFLASGEQDLEAYWEEHGRTLEFVRKSPGRAYPEYWIPPKEEGLMGDVWLDIQAYSYQWDYETEKHEDLLTRVMEMASSEGNLVADFFCGSGTTGAVAERLGRRWIMADLGRFSIHTSRKRLIGLQRQLHNEGKPYRAFDVLNLGRYERQWWQKERLKGADEEHRRVVLEFYKAEPLTRAASPLLHGRRGPVFCHVDGIDSVFSRGEAKAVVQAAKEAGAKEVACLAWEFEMDLRMVCDALEREHGVRIKLIQIPREIMEKNRKEPPPFLEVATLEAEPVIRTKDGKRVVDIKLKRFIPSLAEVPTKELEALQERAVKSGFDFIDFWAVDFDYRNGGPFNHHWQDYRTRKDRSLNTVSEQEFVYPKKGRYTACVKVVDIFGCDTSISVPVEYA